MEHCNLERCALAGLLVMLLAMGALACEKGPASVVLEASDYDQSCGSDDDCILVPAGEQCGPCPACAVDPMSVDGEPKFREALREVDCRTTEPAGHCEPCPSREPYCDQGTCKAREPEKEEDS